MLQHLIQIIRPLPVPTDLQSQRLRKLRIVSGCDDVYLHCRTFCDIPSKIVWRDIRREDEPSCAFFQKAEVTCLRSVRDCGKQFMKCWKCPCELQRSYNWLRCILSCRSTLTYPNYKNSDLFSGTPSSSISDDQMVIDGPRSGGGSVQISPAVTQRHLKLRPCDPILDGRAPDRQS